MDAHNINPGTWMEELAPHIVRKTIRRVVLPGSHDAGTASITPRSPLSPDAPDLAHLIPVELIGPTISSWSRAQGQQLGDQLRAGIRYFDLRVARNDADGRLYYAHSKFGDDVLESIRQVEDFLRSHPKELVVLDFQNFLNLSRTDHAALAQTLETTFADMLVPPPQGGTFPTVESLWSNRMQVVIVYATEAGGDAVLSAHPEFWSRKLLSSRWASTNDPIKLREYLRSVVKWAPSNQLFVLQGVLTPDSDMIVHGLHDPPSSLCDLARIVNPQVLSWCTTEWAKKGLNIIMVDWAVDSNVVDVAIRLNM